MTLAEARTLAQADPVPQLTANWSQTAQKARTLVDQLTYTLRELDKTADALAERGITVNVDLGATGEAARAARRDLEKQKPAGYVAPVNREVA